MKKRYSVILFQRYKDGKKAMKELTDYQKGLLARFNPEKPVKFRYNVVDCEHFGDMHSAEDKVTRYIAPFGGKVTETYWDGRDCGEAYIECDVPFSSAVQILKDGFFTYDPWQEIWDGVQAL